MSAKLRLNNGVSSDIPELNARVTRRLFAAIATGVVAAVNSGSIRDSALDLDSKGEMPSGEEVPKAKRWLPPTTVRAPLPPEKYYPGLTSYSFDALYKTGKCAPPYRDYGYPMPAECYLPAPAEELILQPPPPPPPTVMTTTTSTSTTTTTIPSTEVPTTREPPRPDPLPVSTAKRPERIDVTNIYAPPFQQMKYDQLRRHIGEICYGRRFDFLKTLDACRDYEINNGLPPEVEKFARNIRNYCGVSKSLWNEKIPLYLGDIPLNPIPDWDAIDTCLNVVCHNSPAWGKFNKCASNTTAASVAVHGKYDLAKLHFGIEDLSLGELLGILRSCWDGENAHDSEQLALILDECHNYKQRNSSPDHTRDFALMFTKICLGSKRLTEKLNQTGKTLTYGNVELDRIPSWPAMIRCVESTCFQNFTIDTIAECAALKRNGRWSHEPTLRTQSRRDLSTRILPGGNHTYLNLVDKLEDCRPSDDGKNFFLATLDDCYAHEQVRIFPPAIRDFTEMLVKYCRSSDISRALKRKTQILYRNQTLLNPPDWRAMRGCLARTCRKGRTTPQQLAVCATPETSAAWWRFEPTQGTAPSAPTYGDNDLAAVAMGIENGTYSDLLAGLHSCLGNKQQGLINTIDECYALERSTTRLGLIHKFTLLLNKYCLATRGTPVGNTGLQYENYSLADEPNWYAIEQCSPWALQAESFARLALCAGQEASDRYPMEFPKNFSSSPLSLNISNSSNLTAAELRELHGDRTSTVSIWGLGTIFAAACLASLGCMAYAVKKHGKRQLRETNRKVPLLQDF